MKVSGITEMIDLIKGIQGAFDYVRSVDGKTTKGDQFVPDGLSLYPSDEQARFAAENPEIERALLHEIYEVDRRIKDA
jgi:hypothetical protein